jgi:hypothetical protein
MRPAAGAAAPTHAPVKAACALALTMTTFGALPFACTRAVEAPPPQPPAPMVSSSPPPPVVPAVPSVATTAPPSPPPLVLNPDRAELGPWARYPGFTEVLHAAGRIVLRRPGPTLKILDPDLLHGRDVTVSPWCEDAAIVGDEILCGWQYAAAQAVVVHIPGGEVEPFPYRDVVQVIHVGGETVLERCTAPGTSGRLLVTILGSDAVHGRDVTTEVACNSVRGIVGDALYLGGYAKGDPQRLLHVPSGAIEPYVPADGGAEPLPAVPPLSDETVIGAVRYRRVSRTDGSGSPYNSNRDGLTAFDAETSRPLWHALWDYTSLPIASEGALVVRTDDALVELDPATGRVVWERGMQTAGSDMIYAPLSYEAAVGTDAIAVIEPSTPKGGWVLAIYKRGAPSIPPWTGKIFGVVTARGSVGGRRAGPVEGVYVLAGAERAKTDASGKYELTLTSRGSVRVRTEEHPRGRITPQTKLIALEPGHGPYRVDLLIDALDPLRR